MTFELRAGVYAGGVNVPGDHRDSVLPRVAKSKPKDARVWSRHPHGWYVEPMAVTRALLTVERFAGLSWDPACGGGNICAALLAAGLPAIGTDILRRAAAIDRPWWKGRFDFLGDLPWPQGAVNIITNPPSLTRGDTVEAFLRAALARAPGKVAAFVDVRFTFGRQRNEGLFRDWPIQRGYRLYTRPSCPLGEYLEEGGKPTGGQADYCWLVWDDLKSRRKRQKAGKPEHWQALNIAGVKP